MDYPFSIVHIGPKYLVGLSENMSLNDDKTGLLFRKFMPRRKEISAPRSESVYLVKRFPDYYFDQYDPNLKFEKMLALEIEENRQIEGFETILIQEGLYAVFHNNSAPTDNSLFDYIFTSWLPDSEYELEQRPHLDILAADYFEAQDKHEDILIPVGLKQKG